MAYNPAVGHAGRLPFAANASALLAVKEGDIILIRWKDAWSPTAGGWIDPDTLDDKPEPVGTVGYVLKHNDECIVVAGSVCADMVGGVTAIPLCNIEKLEILCAA